MDKITLQSTGYLPIVLKFSVEYVRRTRVSERTCDLQEDAHREGAHRDSRTFGDELDRLLGAYGYRPSNALVRRPGGNRATLTVTVDVSEFEKAEAPAMVNSVRDALRSYFPQGVVIDEELLQDTYTYTMHL